MKKRSEPDVTPMGNTHKPPKSNVNVKPPVGLQPEIVCNRQGSTITLTIRLSPQCGWVEDAGSEKPGNTSATPGSNNVNPVSTISKSQLGPTPAAGARPGYITFNSPITAQGRSTTLEEALLSNPAFLDAIAKAVAAEVKLRYAPHQLENFVASPLAESSKPVQSTDYICLPFTNNKLTIDNTSSQVKTKCPDGCMPIPPPTPDLVPTQAFSTVVWPGAQHISSVEPNATPALPNISPSLQPIQAETTTLLTPNLSDSPETDNNIGESNRIEEGSTAFVQQLINDGLGTMNVVSGTEAPEQEADANPLDSPDQERLLQQGSQQEAQRGSTEVNQPPIGILNSEDAGECTCDAACLCDDGSERVQGVEETQGLAAETLEIAGNDADETQNAVTENTEKALEAITENTEYTKEVVTADTGKRKVVPEENEKALEAVAEDSGKNPESGIEEPGKAPDVAADDAGKTKVVPEENEKALEAVAENSGKNPETGVEEPVKTTDVAADNVGKIQEVAEDPRKSLEVGAQDDDNTKVVVTEEPEDVLESESATDPLVPLEGNCDDDDADCVSVNEAPEITCKCDPCQCNDDDQLTATVQNINNVTNPIETPYVELPENESSMDNYSGGTGGFASVEKSVVNPLECRPIVVLVDQATSTDPWRPGAQAPRRTPAEGKPHTATKAHDYCQTEEITYPAPTTASSKPARSKPQQAQKNVEDACVSACLDELELQYYPPVTPLPSCHYLVSPPVLQYSRKRRRIPPPIFPLPQHNQYCAPSPVYLPPPPPTPTKCWTDPCCK